MPADFYDLLDVDADASQEAIRSAYREKARKYHPDVNPDARSNDQFKAIRSAYEVLSDATERKDYDRMGHRTYVDQRLGGLPGMNGGSSGGSSRSSHRRSRANRSRSSSTTARTTSRSRSRSSGTGGGNATKSRSTWGERTISEPGARARAMRAGKRVGIAPVAVLAAVAYLAGLATLLASNADVLERLVSIAATGDVAAIGTTLLANGFVEPLAFTNEAVAVLSPGMVFPVGATVFPMVLGATARMTERRVGWLWAICALGPLAGLGLAASGAVVPTVGLDLALYVVLPVIAVVGGVATLWR